MTKVDELFDSSNDPLPTLRELAASETVVEHPDPVGDAFVARMPGDEPHPYADPNPYLSIRPAKLQELLMERLGTEDERLIRRALTVWERVEGGRRP